MSDDTTACTFWDPGSCEGSVHCPPRCPRYVDPGGKTWLVVPERPDDRAALIDMCQDFAPTQRTQGLPPLDEATLEAWVDDLLAAGCNFVATDGDRVVGHAAYTATDDAEPEFVVFVHQEFQGRGIGAELCKHVIATAVAGGRDALVLTVDPENRRAIGLYERLGFEVVEPSDDERDGVLGWSQQMRLPLGTPDVLEYQRAPMARRDRVES